jgi:oligoendopeptidase F
MQASLPTWRFAPENLDAGDLKQLQPLFAELENRPIQTAEELSQWLEDESELQARISAEKARRYIRKTCYTDDESAKERFLDMQREVMPEVEILSNRLTTRFLECPLLDALPKDHYEVLIRKRQSSKEIFRKENTDLQVKESEIQTQQQALMGSIVVEYQGEDYTPQQMAPFYLDQDRDVREAAHAATLESRRPTWNKLHDLYSELITLRHQMGQNAGFDSYTPFRFQQLQRFDYTEDLCKQFHEAVEKTVVPAVGRLNERRKQALGIDTLRPYDLEVDLDGREPFRPFSTEDQLTALVQDIFEAVDPRFRDEFALLQNDDLLDLMSRKGKAPGGYQYSLEDIRLPFIFCNSAGTHSDVQTLLHEGGHAFHSILSRDHPLISYRHAPIEFAETASMSMELLGLENVATVYGEEVAQRTKRHHLEGLLRILPWIATIDAFQHWIYANPNHDSAARETEWLKIMDRFEPDIDYSGLEDTRANRWTGQSHLFSHAFYYIEYGIAQIAALQVWQSYRRNPSDTIKAYRHALSLGGSRALPELFAAAGVKFEVSTSMLGALVEDIETVIG